MTAPKYDDDLIDALREDLPSASDEARGRARLLAAGVLVGNVVSSSSGAAASHAGAVSGSTAPSAGLATQVGHGSSAAAASKAQVSKVVASKVGMASKAGILSKLVLLPTAAKVGLATLVLAATTLPLALGKRTERVIARPTASVGVAPPSITPATTQHAVKSPPPVVEGPVAAAPSRAEVKLPSVDRALAATQARLETSAPAVVAPLPGVTRGVSMGPRRVSAVQARASTSGVASGADVTSAPAIVDQLEAAPTPASDTSWAATPLPPRPATSSQALPSTLGEETELIERALTALAAGDLDHARYWLTEHGRRFPDGLLQHERVRIRERLEREHRSKRD